MDPVAELDRFLYKWLVHPNLSCVEPTVASLKFKFALFEAEVESSKLEDESFESKDASSKD